MVLYFSFAPCCDFICLVTKSVSTKSFTALFAGWDCFIPVWAERWRRVFLYACSYLFPFAATVTILTNGARVCFIKAAENVQRNSPGRVLRLRIYAIASAISRCPQASRLCDAPTTGRKRIRQKQMGTLCRAGKLLFVVTRVLSLSLLRKNRKKGFLFFGEVPSSKREATRKTAIPIKSLRSHSNVGCWFGRCSEAIGRTYIEDEFH